MMLTKLNIILFIYYVFAEQNFQDKMINKNDQQMNNKQYVWYYSFRIDQLYRDFLWSFLWVSSHCYIIANNYFFIYFSNLFWTLLPIY